MKLFILRHGEAEGFMARDEERQLTDRGRADVARVLEAQQDALSSVQRILVSPYVRAQQTAAIVSEVFPDISVHTTPFLVPESNPIELLRWLARRTELHRVARSCRVPVESSRACTMPRAVSGDYWPLDDALDSRRGHCV